MKRLLLIPLLFAALAHAQTPVNAVLIGPEGITITATTGTAVAYNFGANGKYNVVTNVKYPLIVSCASQTTCALIGPAGCTTTCDPDPGVGKSIYAVQQATAYTVTWKNAAGVTTTTPVAALPPPPLPTVTTVATYKITLTGTGALVLTTKSDNSFTLTGTGITVTKQ